MTTIWNDAAFTEIVEKYPELESKSESVAFCTWVYSGNPKATTKELQDQAKDTGLNVAGRAVGSARAVLGMSPLTKRSGGARKSASSKRSRRRAASSATAIDIVGVLKAMEEENQHLRDTIAQLRDACSRALARSSR